MIINQKGQQLWVQWSGSSVHHSFSPTKQMIVARSAFLVSDNGHDYSCIIIRYFLLCRFLYMLLQFEMETNTVHETKYINNLLHNIWPVFFHTAGPRFQFQHFQLQQFNSLKPSSCHDHPYTSFYYKTAVPFSRQEMLIFISMECSWLYEITDTAWSLHYCCSLQWYVCMLMPVSQHLWEEMMQRTNIECQRGEICAVLTGILSHDRVWL